MALRFSKENEFYEGVRSLLIDKDGLPKWNPSDEKSVRDIERFYDSDEENLLAKKLQV